jgi:hypothetical protein
MEKMENVDRPLTQQRILSCIQELPFWKDPPATKHTSRTFPRIPDILSTMDADEEEQRKLRHEAELESYRRYLRCMGLTLIFWFVMLYFIAHDDNYFVVAGAVLLVLWVLYMCACICGNVYLRFQDERESNDGGDDGGDDEEAGLTTASSAPPEGTAAFPYSFAETAKRIHACSKHVAAGKAPTNGTYTAVFSAIFFNKAMRSEGKLRLEFLPTHDNGWTVRGESDFKVSLILEEGFVNANGEMYWMTGESMHRGILDFESSKMFDGEFIAGGSRLLSEKNAPMGRIVRLELERASYYSSIVEMVSFTHGNDEEGDEEETLFS